MSLIFFIPAFIFKYLNIFIPSWECSDFIISSRAKPARSLLTARGLSQLQNSMRHKSFHVNIFLVSANDVMEHFAFPGNIAFAADDQGAFWCVYTPYSQMADTRKKTGA